MNWQTIALFLVSLVLYCTFTSACVTDSECGINSRCSNALCLPGSSGSSAFSGPSCKYDSDCGATGRCLNDRCANSIISNPIVSSPQVPSPVSVPVILVPACNSDSQCSGKAKCVNRLCVVTAGCRRNLDCLSLGLYYECKKDKCKKSDHKICRADDDCKKNWVNKRCINDRCSLI